MADYFPVISRAVAGLESNTGEARRAVYDRARAAIVRQLRSIDPPLPEEDVARERMQLEEAIRKVEAGADGAPATSPAPAAPPAKAADPASAQPNSSPPSSSRTSSSQPSSSQPSSSHPGSPQPSSPRPTPPRPAPFPQSPAFERGPGSRAPADWPKSAPRDPAPEGVETKGGEPNGGAPRSDDRRSGAQRVAPSVPGPTDARPATRADGRPIIQAAGDRPAAAESKRSGPLIALVALGLIALGVGAFAARGKIASLFGGGPATEVAQTQTTPKADAPADKPAEQAANEPPKSDDVGKSDDRLPQDSAAVEKAPDQPSVPAEPSAPAPAPEQEVAKAPEATAPAPAPASPADTPAPTAALVAQRAVLYEEGPNQQSGEALQGTIVWRTESVSGGQSQPLETALRGEIEIPGRKVRATLTIRRNADATLPASHTIEIQFSLPDDFPNAGISNVPGVLMKADESARGSAVSGLSVRVTNGFFLIGLSNLETERTVNEQLLRDRGWIDIPILYDNGRRAVLTLEKGTPGTQAFQEAFSAWRSASSANPAPAR